MFVIKASIIHIQRVVNHIKSSISYYLPWVKPKPILMIIGPTNACNIKCTFCFQSQKSVHKLENRGERFMTLQTLKKTLQEAKELTRFVEFGLFGEPLLHPNISEFIREVKSQDFHLTIDSNGLLYTDEIINTIIDCKVNSVVFSIDGTTKKRYESVRKGSDLDIVKRNLKRIKQLKKEKKSKFPLIIVRGIDLDNKPYHTYEKWIRNLGADHILYSPRQNWSGLFSKKPTNYSKHSSCTFPWKTISIDSDGAVGGCCEDYNVQNNLGNIKKSHIADIWYGEDFKQLRKLHRNYSSNTRFSACIDCSYLKNKTLPLNVRLQLYKRALKEFFIEMF